MKNCFFFICLILLFSTLHAGRKNKRERKQKYYQLILKLEQQEGKRRSIRLIKRALKRHERAQQSIAQEKEEVVDDNSMDVSSDEESLTSLIEQLRNNFFNPEDENETLFSMLLPENLDTNQIERIEQITQMTIIIGSDDEDQTACIIQYQEQTTITYHETPAHSTSIDDQIEAIVRPAIQLLESHPVEVFTAIIVLLTTTGSLDATTAFTALISTLFFKLFHITNNELNQITEQLE